MLLWVMLGAAGIDHKRPDMPMGFDQFIFGDQNGGGLDPIGGKNRGPGGGQVGKKDGQILLAFL